MNNQEILIIGAAIVDVLARPVDENIFTVNSTPMEDIRISTGGDALNEAVILSRMGKKVQLETIVGDDMEGKIVLERCRECGIALSEDQIRSDIPTGINIVLIGKEGERNFLTNPKGTLRRLKLDDIRMPFDDDIKILCFASIFIFPEIGVKELKKIFSQAKSQGITVCADMTNCKCGETAEDMKEAFEYIDYLLPNESEACLLTGKKTAEEAAQNLIDVGVKNVIIKCGSRGCLVKTQTEEYMVPAKENVTCIDTTGAGDSFVAGFNCALLDGKGLRECAEYANECGGRSVGTVGATEWSKELF